MDNFTESMLTDNATTNSTQMPYVRDEELAKIEIAVQGIILCLAILGNGIVLIVLLTQHKKLSRMNLMIIHLCMADLSVAFFNVLPQMAWDITYRFVGGDFLCRTVKYLQVVTMYASAYVLIMTAVDRYLAICHPLTVHTWTHRKMHLLVALAWVLSLVFALPQLVIFSYREMYPLGSGIYDCWGQFTPEWTLELYITWFTLAIYIVPCLILTLLYGKICYVAWQSSRCREVQVLHKKRNCFKLSNSKTQNSYTAGFRKADLRTVEKPRAHAKTVSRAKVKTVKLTLTVIACYLICWGPFFVAQMWSAWDQNAPFNSKCVYFFNNIFII